MCFVGDPRGRYVRWREGRIQGEAVYIRFSACHQYSFGLLKTIDDDALPYLPALLFLLVVVTVADDDDRDDGDDNDDGGG